MMLIAIVHLASFAVFLALAEQAPELPWHD